MNKVLSELVDRFALLQLHKERSSTWHFNCRSGEIEDFDMFYKAPHLPAISFEEKNTLGDYKIGNYSFKSEIQINDTCNNYSSGLYYINNKNKSPINVVFVHGWRASGHEKQQNIYLEKFMSLNYNMYFATLPYHLERNSDSALYNGELMISADIDRTLLSVKQAVSDIRALIRWLKENNSGQVILIGLSLGGLISNLVGVTEREVDALVSIFYANDLSYTVWEAIPGKYIKADFERHGFTYRELIKKWKIINPSSFKPVIPKENILLLT
ncbi:MAG: alpha/beta hydrolase, partial [Bacillota bacterium]